MGGQKSDAMAQMQEKKKNMSHQQREMMERMMQDRGIPGMAAPAKTEYRKTGTDKVGKWTCDKYEGYRDNQKVSELCTVDPKARGLAASDFEVTRQMAEFFKALIPQGSDRLFAFGKPEEQGYSGVPVRRTSTLMNAT